MQPLLRGRLERDAEGLIILGHDGAMVRPAAEASTSGIAALAGLLDGRRTLPELRRDAGAWFDGQALEELLQELDRHDLLDDAAAPACRSGLEVLFELELLTQQLCARSIYRNPFWTRCLTATNLDELPLQVIHGLVIENYHFLHRESYFDAPVLSYVSNTEVRLALNEFFAEEYGHDEILLRSLNLIGLSREDLAGSVPLPETLGLCNALAFWALNDPLFFFTTLGLLEGQGAGTDSFIDACERVGVDSEFIKPLRTHSQINLTSNHGDLTRRIFGALEAIDEASVARLRAQTHLFVELYDAFYAGVWRHYATSPTLLRRISDL
jgi:hypothetical protein